MELVKFRNNWNGNSYKTMNIRDFVNALTTCIEDKKMYGDSEETDFYEYTGNNDSVVCAYFDYDEYISKEIWDKLHEKDGDEYVYEKHENEIKDGVKLWFSETLNDCATMRNHRIVKGKDGEKYKFSYRLNFYNIVCYKHELKEMVSHIKNKVHALDIGVYDPHRKMRCVNTAKPETPNQAMQLVEGSIEQTLIQYYSNKSYDMYRLTDFCSYNEIDYKPYFENKKNETNLKEEDGSTTDETMSVITEPETMSVPNMENWTDLDKLVWCCKSRFETGRQSDYAGIIQAIKNTYNAKDSELSCQKYTMLYGTENKKNEFEKWYKCIKKHVGKERTLTLNSIYHWARVDNPSMYQKLIEKKKVVAENIHIITGDERGAMDYLWNKTYKDRLKYCNCEFYLKVDNKWINSTKEVNSILNNEILKANLYKEKETSKGGTELVPYSSKRKNAVDIGKCILDECIVQKDDKFIENFRKTNKNKICFKNGVLDLTNGEFSSWEDNKHVYTTIIIPNNYVQERNEDDIVMVKDLLKSIFNEKWEVALKFYARALGGNKDKVWSIFMGLRNCGKGTAETLLRASFGDYVGSANSSYFISKQNKEPDVKDMGWVQDIQFQRIVMVQEFQEGQNIKVNGTIIKSFSGGDIIENRKNFQDPVKTLPEGTLMFLNNSMPNYAKRTEDCVKNCLTFSSINQYVTEYEIEQAKEEKKPESYIKTLKVGDAEIKEKVVYDDRYRNAFIHLITDYWSPTPVTIVNDFKEDEDENAVDCGILICKSFVKTDDKKDKIKVSTLKDWCKENEIEYAKQMKPYLKNMGCVEYKSDGIINFKFIKMNENIDTNDGVENED
jgi:hypothetical protein